MAPPTPLFPRRLSALALCAALWTGCSGGEPERPAAPPEPSASRAGAEADAGVATRAPAPDTQEVRTFRGMMTYLADAARFTDCRTGASLVLAQEGAYLDAERAYLDAGAQGDPLLLTFEGRQVRRAGMEGGAVDALVVERFMGAEPGAGCGGEPVTAGLERTVWRLVALPGPGDVAAGVDATLLLDPDAGQASGSTGCNRFSGAYDLEGGRLTVSVTALTRMTCPEAAAAVEAGYLEALRLSGGYRFSGPFLELLGETGPVARFAPSGSRSHGAGAAAGTSPGNPSGGGGHLHP